MHQAERVSPTQESQDHRSARPGFRPDIEGLRAVAVLSVVLFHAEVPGIGGGFVGVDVFFVISGFLITRLLWREANSTGTVRLRSFYAARARRLLPASALVGIVTMVASVFLIPTLRIPTVLYDGIASALYVGNYWLIIDDVNYFANLLSPSPFLHYWSLGVEEQFYLVWAPLILGTAWLVRRLRRRTRAEATSSVRPFLIVLALVAVVSFALSLCITFVLPTVAFFSLPTRAWQLALGGLVALTAEHWQKLSPHAAAIAGWIGLALILLACTWFTATTVYPGVAAVLPTAAAVLVVGAGCAAPAQGCGHLLGWAPMQAIGRFSYSWYLWHWPILVLAPALMGHPLGLPARLAAVVLSAALAWLTLRILENPLRFAPKIRTSAWRGLGLGAMATLMAVGVGVALLVATPIPTGHGHPAKPVTITATPVPPGLPAALFDAAVQDTFAQVQSALAASVNVNSIPSNLDPALAGLEAEHNNFAFDGCVRSPYQDGQPDCVSGDASSATRVALIGDSHAAMWIPGFQQIADQRRWRLETLAKEACPIVDVRVDSVARRMIENLQHCQKWRAQIMTRLRAERPQLVVVSVWRGYGTDESLTRFTAYDQAWLDGLSRLVRQLRDTGTQVLVLGPIPAAHKSVPNCLSGHLDDATACVLSRSDSVNPSGIAAEAAATEAAGGHYADLTDLFCTADRCPVIVGNTQVYLDVNHLTFEYGRLVAPAIGALADRALAHGNGWGT
ncbi:acyltransferase family protein [Mycolicibacterium aichiense]|uniref:acyltransferase family protein n=1 Tax=Mycolicibacterium aichiense TaxID=1799 RepID=UPI003D6792AD